MKIVLACTKLWDSSIADRISAQLNAQVSLVLKEEELSPKYLEEIKPDYIFFPHWSFLIKPEIYTQYSCIMFHMTDLPFGRGGSPLQNLIVRGHKSTKISAFKCDGGLDTGPVYLKKDLDLSGSAGEIFLKASKIIEAMIFEIVKTKPVAVPQSGEVTEFKRRKPEDGNLKNLSSPEEIYDYIRMLDAEGYPSAFLEFGDFKVEFKEAGLIDGKVKAAVTISRKGEK